MQDEVMDVKLADWGKVILEEVLFRAARDIGAGHSAVTVALEFHLAPNAAARGIQIRVAGAVEQVIRTVVPLE